MVSSEKSFIDQFLTSYYLATSKAAEFEIKLRLSAEVNKIDVSAKIRKGKKLKHKDLLDIEAELIQVCGNKITRDDIEFLDSSRRVRNALIHCDFPILQKNIDSASPLFKEWQKRLSFSGFGGVYSCEIENDGTIKYEGRLEDNPKKPLFGWIMKACMDNTFSIAYEILNKAIEIIEKTTNI